MNDHAPDPQPRITVLLEGSGPRLVDPNYIDGEEKLALGLEVKQDRLSQNAPDSHPAAPDMNSGLRDVEPICNLDNLEHPQLPVVSDVTDNELLEEEENEYKEHEFKPTPGSNIPVSETAGGQKRSRKENSSPEPNAGESEALDPVVKLRSDAHSNPARKRKINPTLMDVDNEHTITNPAPVSALKPSAADHFVEITSAPAMIGKAGRDPNHKLEITSALNCVSIHSGHPLLTMLDNPKLVHAQLSEVLAALNNAVLPQIELLSRSINQILRENKRLISTLSKYGIKHCAHDKLEDSRSAALFSTHQPTEFLKPKPVPMDVELAQDTKAARYGPMNSDRSRRIDANIKRTNHLSNLTPADAPIKKKTFSDDFNLPLNPEKTNLSHDFEHTQNPLPMEVETYPQQEHLQWGTMNPERRKRVVERKSRLEARATRSNLLSNLTPADITIKEKAFTTDFNRTLNPEQTQLVEIYSLVGDKLVAKGYDRAVVDGESIWLEIPENLLCKQNFIRRQTTSSRQYFTASGVTIHQQLDLEHGRSPRRQKLAVKIPRAEPSSRLTAGKWYIHVHQVKMKLNIIGLTQWSLLRLTRLIKILRRTFGQNYHPRSYDYKQYSRPEVSPNNKGRRYQNNFSHKSRINEESYNTKQRKPWQQLQKAFEDCPMPMFAPESSQNSKTHKPSQTTAKVQVRERRRFKRNN